MKKSTCEFPLKPVVMHRNKQWHAQGEFEPEICLRNCTCSTEWRHCPVVTECDWGPECDRIPAYESISENAKVFEDIDLSTCSRTLRLIVDRGVFRFVRIPTNDRDLLIAYDREYDRTERSHIKGNYLRLLEDKLVSLGYSTDIHDVRKRLR